MADSLTDAMVQVRNAMTGLTSAHTILSTQAPTATHPGATTDACLKAIKALRTLNSTLKSHPSAPSSLVAWPD